VSGGQETCAWLHDARAVYNAVYIVSVVITYLVPCEDCSVPCENRSFPSMAPITVRPPSTSSKPQPSFTSPEPTWLHGTWHVTHSTLPMWRTKRNVQITYTPIPKTNDIDDLVTYQELESDKVKSIRGVDKPSSMVPSAWDWRGKGWLMIASSHWEILGYGEETVDHGEFGSVDDEPRGRQKWAITFFSKTLFTPAGIDIYSQFPEGLRDETVSEIKEALSTLGDADVEELVGQIFKVASC